MLNDMTTPRPEQLTLPVLAWLQASPVRCSAYAVLFVRRPLSTF